MYLVVLGGGRRNVEWEFHFHYFVQSSPGHNAINLRLHQRSERGEGRREHFINEKNSTAVDVGDGLVLLLGTTPAHPRSRVLPPMLLVRQRG